MSAKHVIGMEAAGVVEAVGDGVSAVRPGDRVAYASDKPRTYSQATVMPDSADRRGSAKGPALEEMECHRVRVVLKLLREQEQSRL
jgi:NADPH:quinone reductase-like Zn-dependent oxidoreductase